MADMADKTNFASSRFKDFCQRNPVNAADANDLVRCDPPLHQPISHNDPTRLDHTIDDNHIPVVESSNGNEGSRPGAMKCCCGRPECAYLEHNNAALGGLERDLETAARLGQALLDRHEAYVRESQAEQARLSQFVAELENEKTSLQDANHKIVVENRELLQKLEQLNIDLGESSHKVQDLEGLLQDCEQEIRRLNGLTRKTQELELRMLDMERERAEFDKRFADSKDETRSTVARWKESERKIRELEQEVQRIEWAAKADREKHEEIVARMERDRSLERELGLSEGRLKATAAIQDIKSNGPREKQVVSNFVRDILQDNANLQAGIAELRELLQSSNDEVQNLREQVMLHQPVGDDSTPTTQRSLSLSDELALSRSPPKPVQQEVHVHHHYHTKLGSKKEKTPVRKPSRRKALMPSALSVSPSVSGASTPLPRPQWHGSSPAIPFNIRAKDARTNRWSMQSTATTSTYMSSMASSPRSYFDRNSSIFDRMERDEESSRPTSPDSFTMSSPMPFRKKLDGDDQALSVFEEEVTDDTEQSGIEEPDASDPPSISTHDNNGHTPSGTANAKELIPELELTPKPRAADHKDHVMVEDVPKLSEPQLSESDPSTSQSPKPDPEARRAEDINKDNVAMSQALISDPDGDHNQVTPFYHIPEIRPSIRRRNSHDSLLSISGMDIHLAQTPTPRSALTLLRGSGANKHYFAPSPSSARKVSATQPLAAVTEYTAISRPGLDNTPSASMVALSGIRSADNTSNTPQSKGLMGSVGGWVRGKWGIAPTKSIADLRTTASASTSVSSSLNSQHPSLTKQLSSTSTKAKSSADSQHSVASTSTSNSKSSAGRTKGSSSNLEVPQQTRSITISNHGRKDSSTLMASSFMGGRTPGINQTGAIPGFAAAMAARRAPTEIEASQIDVKGLKESLREQ